MLALIPVFGPILDVLLASPLATIAAVNPIMGALVLAAMF